MLVLESGLVSLATLLRNPVMLWLGSVSTLAIIGGRPLRFGGEEGARRLRVTRVKSSSASPLEAGFRAVDGTLSGRLGGGMDTVLMLLPRIAYVIGLSL